MNPTDAGQPCGRPSGPQWFPDGPEGPSYIRILMLAGAFGASSLLLAVVALLRAANNAPAQDEEGVSSKTTAAATGEDSPPVASPKDDPSPVLKPRHESGQRLFKTWQDNARTDGKIPGGALRSLAEAVTNFIRLNPTHERVPQLTEFLKRIGAFAT